MSRPSRKVGAELAYYREMATTFRARAASARYLGWRSEMFDHLRAAAFCTVQVVRCLRQVAS
jgi:hypothetical protein